MQAAYREWYSSEGTELVSVFPGVPAMLDELKANGLTRAIVISKTPMRHHNGRPWGATVEIGRLGLDGLFTMVVGEEDTPDSKPAPGPYCSRCESSDYGPRTCLWSGDSHIDVGAAKAAGVASAGAA